MLACILSTVLYSSCLGAISAKAGYWKGLLSLLSIFLLAHAYAEIAYFLKMDAIHRDESEAIGVSVLYLAASFVTAFVFYPIGYWVSRRLFRRAFSSKDSLLQEHPRAR
jgi:hypothetical protein